MSYATSNSVFGHPPSYKFDSQAQVYVFEQPIWFKPKSFNSLAAWVIVFLEETLWTQY